jgi:D-3-phosphoglycerate dehydrogenase
MRPFALHLELEAYPAQLVAHLEQYMEVRGARPESPDDLRAALAEAPFDTLIVTLGLRIDESVMTSCPTLRWIVTPTTGLDHVDLEAAHRYNVRVVSLRDTKAQITQVSATAELAWGLLLAVARGIPSAHAAVSAGHWDRREFLGVELAGRTLGVAGAGRLGRMVAQYGLAFGMKVIAHDTDPSAFALLPSAVRPVTADELIESSHVLSLHLPLDESTINWLDASRIERLAPGAIVINTARGQLLDEEALASALASGRIRGVGVDVLGDDSTWDGQTVRTPLIAALEAGHNVVATPHIGGYGVDAVAHTREVITRRFLELRFLER